MTALGLVLEAVNLALGGLGGWVVGDCLWRLRARARGLHVPRTPWGELRMLRRETAEQRARLQRARSLLEQSVAGCGCPTCSAQLDGVVVLRPRGKGPSA